MSVLPSRLSRDQFPNSLMPKVQVHKLSMKKILYWIPTLIWGCGFFVILLIFHPIQMLMRRIGYQAHKRSVDIMCWCLNQAMLFTGNLISYENPNQSLPTDRPLIVVSNHQSMMDIPVISWVFRKHHPKFISKKELEYGIPSVSYNLRHGGSVTIDRKEPRKAIRLIAEFADYLNEHNFAGCIFPEGTRSKDGQLLPFQPMGLLKMLRNMPDARVVPVALKNYWRLGVYNYKPVPFGVPLKCTVLPPIDRDISDKEIIRLLETQIKEELSASMYSRRKFKLIN